MLKVDHHDMYVQNTVLKTARINRHGKHRTSKAWRLGTWNSWSVSRHGGFQVSSDTCLQEIVPKRLVSSQLYTCMKLCVLFE